MRKLIAFFIGCFIFFTASADAELYYIYMENKDNDNEYERGDVVDCIPVAGNHPPNPKVFGNYKVIIADITERQAHRLCQTDEIILEQGDEGYTGQDIEKRKIRARRLNVDHVLFTNMEHVPRTQLDAKTRKKHHTHIRRRTADR